MGRRQRVSPRLGKKKRAAKSNLRGDRVIGEATLAAAVGTKFSAKMALAKTLGRHAITIFRPMNPLGKTGRICSNAVSSISTLRMALFDNARFRAKLVHPQ
jgi:hypothetical protein